ncbi:unnamed protein product [Clavelina lepadiformis]|uniref:Uncharacterized protein n=1 Tax=Clavelina lepadiformis TaxID=159417 RepID=A0ABP0GTB5_CLALP
MGVIDGANGTPLQIGTHNGAFHCDEVLACFMLKNLPKYKDAKIVRTRDQAKLDLCDIVVDVGGVFDVQKNRFDHHQRSFNESFHSLHPDKKWTTKLSSAGLVYCHFGEEVLRAILGQNCPDEKTLCTVYDKVYENFVEEIDAIDNGISQYDGKAKYNITTTLSSRVSYLNPSWNDENNDEYECFQEAMRMVGKEFVERVTGLVHHWLPARSIVLEALEKRFEVHESGKVIKLERFCPWKEHLFRLEETGFCGQGEIKYVLYADKTSQWRIQCVPTGRNTFENRLSLLSKWRGLRDKNLSEISGIPNCVFVHSNGFIGGNENYEGVLKMASECLQQSES